VHLPVLRDEQGAPYGVSLLGRRGDDKALLQLALDLCGASS
jgi:aspartyl-tRNA(Asn)/glutamyl-tRNA(Gln) amidotransferase subunit A